MKFIALVQESQCCRELQRPFQSTCCVMVDSVLVKGIDSDLNVFNSIKKKDIACRSSS